METSTQSGSTDSLSAYRCDVEALLKQVNFSELNQYIDNHRRTGDEREREKVLICGLKYVLIWAYKYSKTFNRGWEHILDLAQVGNLGLMRALDCGKYQPEKGSFLNYATARIKAKMRVYVIRQPIVHESDSLFTELDRVGKIVLFSEHDLHRELTPEDLSDLGLSQETIALYQRRQVVCFKSLDSPDKGERSVLHRIVSQTDTVENFLLELSNRDMESKVLNYLTEKHKPSLAQKFAMRYGLGGYSEHSLQQIADKFGCTRQAIHKSIEKVLLNGNFRWFVLCLLNRAKSDEALPEEDRACFSRILSGTDGSVLRSAPSKF
jgi:RNA polymerase primary sigma factor